MRSEGHGHGSEFTVWLPRMTGRGAGAAPATASGDGAPERYGADPLRVLIAEDNADSAESFQTLIELEGHQVRVVFDGRDIVPAATEFLPHVVFLDIGLPGIDGYEAARRLRSDARLRDSLLIAVSGYGRDEDKEAARHAGFLHHLTKPVDFDTIRRLLAGAGRSPSGHGRGSTLH